MHELSLCESVITIIEQQARTECFERVEAVWLEIGQLSNVEPDAIRFSFDIAKQGTIAEAAQLHIIDIPGKAQCNNCQQQVPIEQIYMACPLCDQPSLTIIDGQQMRIKHLEVC